KPSVGGYSVPKTIRLVRPSRPQYATSRQTSPVSAASVTATLRRCQPDSHSWRRRLPRTRSSRRRWRTNLCRKNDHELVERERQIIDTETDELCEGIDKRLPAYDACRTEDELVAKPRADPRMQRLLLGVGCR